VKPVTAAAIYARISADIEGTGQGVKRQITDCRKLADQLGWPVHDVYEDNDHSAYSGIPRPEYLRMLDDIRAGVVDAIIVYHLDRLTRRPIELEQFSNILSEAGVTNVRFVAGDMDIGTDDGLLIGRIQGAVAAKESADKSRRIKRKLDQVAEEGRPHGGSNRPFGFEDDKITHNADEVAIVRQVLARFLAGESTRSIATWLDDNGVRTVRGGPWRTTSVNAILTKPRMIGMREHRDGTIVGPAIWEPIISVDERNQVLSIIESKRTSGRRTPRRYLLSGLVRCGRCNQRLYSAARQTTRRYVCMAGPDHGGCGRMTVVAAPLDQFVADAVLLRLDTPDLSEALSGQVRADADNAALLDNVAGDKEKLENLARAYANNQISMTEWITARKIIEERVEASERKIRRSSTAKSVTAVIGQGRELRAQWSTLNLGRQRAIVDAIVDHIVIHPGQSGARSLDPERVEIRWRL